ncbi:MAG TPA: hypothetical protein VGB24_15295 [Longimicrobium sp.]|uniref:hypothetical protein n=1 Tax=Longimicrobium sp. TaxID=2029185 RepID=UPI002ED87927
MPRLIPLFAILGAVVSGCAPASSSTPAEPGAPRYGSTGRSPCLGRGEKFFDGEPTDGSQLPGDATITRRVHQRGWVGYCYTTPASTAAH